MNGKPVGPKPFLILMPLIGMGLFVVLYILAALKYPGGSWHKLDQDGFSFSHNYLCDLLDYFAVNGDLNDGRFYARAALGVLCASIILIWFFLPKLFSTKNINLQITRLSGILSLLITVFLASGTHDLIIRIAGIFGSIAVILCLVELWRAHYTRLFFLGTYCLIIFLLNYFVYETGQFIRILPVLQKITFISFILWFVLLNFQIIKNFKSIKSYGSN